MGEPSRFKPVALTLGLLVGVAAAFYPLLPEPYRPWNVAAFGAVALFVAARVGLVPALLLALGSKLAFDLLNYRQHGFEADYLPSWPIYACFALYAVAGWYFLRRTESPWKIASVSVLSGVPFFLVTNFLAWQGKALPYPDTLDGLLQSYWMALPFHRGTLVSDLAFGGVLFALHAALSRAYFPAERVALQPEAVR
jgi:hypothetical protein